jgi:trimethylamine:corrinoid methyltransferase-like protein
VNAGEKTVLERAKERVGDLLKKYEPPAINEKTKAELRNITEKAAQKFGMQKLPEIE